MENIINAKIFVRQSEEKRPRERTRCRWKGHTDMECKTITCENVDWIYMSQKRDQWRALVKG